MTVRCLVLVVALGFFPQAGLAGARGGGSHGSSHASSGRSPSSGGGHHPAPSARSAHPRSSGGRSYSARVTSPGSGSHLTDAQRRQPRPGTGTGYRYRRGYFYPSRPYYYSYYSPFYFPYYAYGWPYDGMHVSAFYGSPYGYDGYGSYPYDRNGDTGALRLLVDPEETRVYVDGDYAGIADDFSGLSQRLHISPGRHEITLELEGYRAHRVRVYVGAGQTLRIEYTMPKGTGPETFEDLSGEVEDRYSQSPNRYESEQSTNRRDDRGRVRLAPVVRPDDASVYVDGEFKGAARQVHSLELPPGRHRIEVVRPGFRTEERDVDVDRDSGAGSELVIELQRL